MEQLEGEAVRPEQAQRLRVAPRLDADHAAHVGGLEHERVRRYARHVRPALEPGRDHHTARPHERDRVPDRRHGVRRGVDDPVRLAPEGVADRADDVRTSVRQRIDLDRRVDPGLARDFQLVPIPGQAGQDDL
nr:MULTISPECIES: hypothetical protein [unclassified Pseudonocardia]